MNTSPLVYCLNTYIDSSYIVLHCTFAHITLNLQMYIYAYRMFFIKKNFRKVLFPRWIKFIKVKAPAQESMNGTLYRHYIPFAFEQLQVQYNDLESVWNKCAAFHWQSLRLHARFFYIKINYPQWRLTKNKS